MGGGGGGGVVLGHNAGAPTKHAIYQIVLPII